MERTGNFKRIKLNDKIKSNSETRTFLLSLDGYWREEQSAVSEPSLT